MTQRNRDGSIRDFIDYDANLLAIAFGIPSRDRAEKIIARIHKGPCTHASISAPRPTYVSERFYDAKNCYNGNTGDSAVTMGRIGWAEGLNYQINFQSS